MKKRFLSILLACSVLMPSFCVPAMGAEKEEESFPIEKGFGYEHKITSQKPVFLIDFDNENGASVSMTGTAKASDKAGIENSAGIKTGDGLSLIYLPQESKKTEGKYLLSFDFKREKNSNTSYVWLRWNDTYSRTNSSHPFSLRDGLLGRIWDFPNWYYTGVEYTENTWVHVNMFADLDAGTIDLFFNNEYYDRIYDVYDSDDMYFSIRTDDGAKTNWDNFAFFEFTNDLRNELGSLGVNMPANFGDNLELNLYSKYSGNIFTEFSDVEMKLDVINKDSKDAVYDIEYRVEDFWFNEKDYGKIENVTLGKGESITHNIYPDVDKYGIYTTYIKAVRKDGTNESFEINREFSVANIPTPGYKKEWLGMCAHPGRNQTNWNEIERAFEISGISFVRTDGSWSQIETEKGVYNTGRVFEVEATTTVPVRTPNFFQDRADEGIKNLLIWGPNNEKLYGKNAEGASFYERISKSPEDLAAIERAAEATARIYKGRIQYFELGNELNFQRVEVMSPEVYTRICQAAYKGFKKGNPDCIVISHGHTRAAPDLIYRYLMEAKRNGQGKPFDGVAIHPYIGNAYPEQTNWETAVLQATKAIERAGYTRDDYQVWITETGGSQQKGYFSETQYANLFIRAAALVEGFEICDYVAWFAIQSAELNTESEHHWYGSLKGREQENANAARLSYLALCNYNALTENAKVVYKQRYDEENTVLVKYKKPDNVNTILAYTTDTCKEVTLDLGDESIKIYDLYGNPTEISSKDGKYTITLTDTPIYIETEGEKLEYSENNEVSKNREKIELAKGSKDTFEVVIPEGAELELIGTENMVIENTVEGQKNKITVSSPTLPKRYTYPGMAARAGMYTEHVMSDGTYLYRDYIYGFVKENGIATDMIMLPVEYVYESADVEFTVRPYDSMNTTYWKGVLKITNNTDFNISGTVTFKEPIELKNLAPITVNNLLPGEVRKVSFNLPQAVVEKACNRSGVFTLTSGEEIGFWLGDLPRSIHFNSPEGALAIRTLEKVTDNDVTVIDGNLTAEEWANYKLCDFDKSQVSYGSQGYDIDGVKEKQTFTQSDDYGGLEDFSGSIYAKWDDEFIYAASIVYDDVHWAKQDVRSFYYDDVFYIGGKETRTQRHEAKMDIALSDYFEYSDVFFESEKHGVIWNNYTDAPEGHHAQIISGDEFGVDTGARCYVTRKNNITIYETKIPWSEIIPKEAFERGQFVMNFSHRDYDGDRDKTNSFTGWFVLTDSEEYWIQK